MDITDNEVKELITGLTTILAEALESKKDNVIAETFSVLDEEFRNDPASILILLKASLILNATFAQKHFKGD